MAFLSVGNYVDLRFSNMKNILNRTTLACLAFVLATYAAEAQTSQEGKVTPVAAYRATPEKVNSLVHTKLDVRFDYNKRQLIGKEWLTLKPYAYATDSLRLDAKGMTIKMVALVNDKNQQKLKFAYDNEQLNIQLGKTYKPGETYNIYIEYVARPDELKVKGSAAISDAKGLYFINPDSTVAGKPVQIWTQGETEASSAWFPTIDHTNQKTTSEISMTVPAKYVTLSNGALTSQVKNNNGTRTDTWKMDLPHSPYLFMMAVGDFKVYKDKWRDKEVSYYLEPAYAPYAKDIFGTTPEMMEFFSKTLGVDYPWNKYSQVVVRDFVSGAMENTTATLHGEYVQRTPREILDERFSQAESTIPHELFHHWFGDYVTAESWSNLTVNESFANYSEYLWAAHKYGKDVADEHNYEDMNSYLRSKSEASKHLVRFHYNDKEDMFDAVSYQKGGRILHMMRTYLGDEVFFKGLNIYLTQNAFKNGEAHQLRLAMEEASGKDLNWFFNQWYFNAGHPELSISYAWDAASKTQRVTLKQTQEGNVFTIPMAVDVYAGGKMQRHKIVMTQATQTFSFPSAVEPNLVNVDAEKVLLTKKDDQKSMATLSFQYTNAPLYVDRLEAVVAAAKAEKDADANKILVAALNDKFAGIRTSAIESINLKDAALAEKAIPVLQKLAASDQSTLVQAAALSSLATRSNAADLPLFKKALESQSYAVQGAALMGLALQQPDEALVSARVFEKDSKAALTQSIVNVYAQSGAEKELPFVTKQFDAAGIQEKVDMIPAYLHLLGKVNDTKAVNKGVDEVKALGIKYKNYGINTYVSGFLEQLKTRKQSDQATVSYINAALAELK